VLTSVVFDPIDCLPIGTAVWLGVFGLGRWWLPVCPSSARNRRTHRQLHASRLAAPTSEWPVVRGHSAACDI